MCCYSRQQCWSILKALAGRKIKKRLLAYSLRKNNYFSRNHWLRWYVLLFKAILLKFFSSIVGRERMRYYMIISTKYTTISEVINNGWDKYYYSMQLFYRILEHSSRNRNAERLHDYFNKIYNYFWGCE